MDTFGAEVDFVLASSHFSTNPHLTAAIPRIRSICSITSAFWFNSTSSVPLIPRSDALINTIGLEQSKTVTSAGPYPGTSKISFFCPVGKSFPVLEPAGSSKYISIREPVPGTPLITSSPYTSAWPSFTRTCSSMILLVLVFKIRTTVIGSTAGTRPSSMANGPTADEIFPQLALPSTLGMIMSTWRNV